MEPQNNHFRIEFDTEDVYFFPLKMTFEEGLVLSALPAFSLQMWYNELA